MSQQLTTVASVSLGNMGRNQRQRHTVNTTHVHPTTTLQARPSTGAGSAGSGCEHRCQWTRLRCRVDAEVCGTYPQTLVLRAKHLLRPWAPHRTAPHRLLCHEQLPSTEAPQVAADRATSAKTQEERCPNGVSPSIGAVQLRPDIRTNCRRLRPLRDQHGVATAAGLNAVCQRHSLP